MTRQKPLSGPNLVQREGYLGWDLTPKIHTPREYTEERVFALRGRTPQAVAEKQHSGKTVSGQLGLGQRQGGTEQRAER